MGVTNTTSMPVDVFHGLRALNVQTYTESNTKLGLQHELSIYDPALIGGGVIKTILVTGDENMVIKARLVSHTGAGIKADVFEGPTYTGGVDTPYFNATTVKPLEGSLTILRDATVTDNGTQVFASAFSISNTSRQGSGSTGTVLGGDHVLSANTTYLLTLESLDTQAQGVSSLVSWYEGPLDLPLEEGIL